MGVGWNHVWEECRRGCWGCSWQEVGRILEKEGESERWMKEVKEERKKVKERES